MKKLSMALAAAVVSGAVFGFEYNVRKPSEETRPAWRGASAGKWTMDYEAAQAGAKAAGVCHLQLVTGSWWCPHCEAFEEKVVLSDVWRRFISDRGYYLSMLDFPYRGHVSDDQLHKSAHPEMGDGWGFKCWLYDAEYLAENLMTEEDGFREIQKLYEKQKALAPESANLVTIKTWDGSEEFTYGKVGYPTLIIYLPDGTEAGRFVPYVTNLEPEEAREFVLGRINAIISEALDAQCGLCADPEEGGLSGESAQKYLGWLVDGANGVAGTISATAAKANRKGEIKVKATVVARGKKAGLSGVATNGAETVTLTKGGKAANEATLRFGTDGLSGTYTDGTTTYSVYGARDVFSAPRDDAAAKARSASVETGVWSFAMRPDDSVTAPFAGGMGALSVTVKAKGKAKVVGRLGDGTSVNVSGQVIAGEDGVCCLPVVANLYPGKTGGFGCILWFLDGMLFNVTEIGDWVCTKKGGEFTAGWWPIYTAASGIGEISEDMELLFDAPPAEIGGYKLAVSPEADSITATNTTKWKGTELSAFAARLNVKTGVVSGTMSFFGENGAKPKKIGASVYGVVVGNTAFMSVIVKKVGSWAAKASSCSACED